MSGLIRAVIDTQALRHNLNVIRARAGRAKVIAVVKANAYGHGLVSAALAIQDAGAFAVARLEEGMSLRQAGITSRIVLLEGETIAFGASGRNGGAQYCGIFGCHASNAWCSSSVAATSTSTPASVAMRPTTACAKG